MILELYLLSAIVLVVCLYVRYLKARDAVLKAKGDGIVTCRECGKEYLQCQDAYR